MTKTLTDLAAEARSIETGLQTATAQHERAVAALFDAHRRPLYGDEIFAEKRDAANAALYAQLDDLTARAASTAAAVQQAADGADPLLQLRSEELTRFAALAPTLTAEALAMPAADLAARARAAQAGSDKAVSEVYRRALVQRRAAAIEAGDRGDGTVRIDPRAWSSELERIMEDLNADTTTAEAQRLQDRLVGLRIDIVKTRQAADGTRARALEDFTAAIRNF